MGKGQLVELIFMHAGIQYVLSMYEADDHGMTEDFCTLGWEENKQTMRLQPGLGGFAALGLVYGVVLCENAVPCQIIAAMRRCMRWIQQCPKKRDPGTWRQPFSAGTSVAKALMAGRTAIRAR